MFIYISVVTHALENANLDATQLEAIGITNQRETTVVWDVETGNPVYNALVWQDSRTTDRVEDLQEADKLEWIRDKTGLEADAGSLTEVANLVSFPQTFFSEVVITAIQVGVIFALVDEWNPMGTRDNPAMAAFTIGLLVAALVQYEAPVSMAALNPARDLGPRVFGFIIGYGEIAFPGPRGGFWLPSVSTLVGGVLGGGLYDYATRTHLIELESEDPTPEPDAEAAADD